MTEILIDLDAGHPPELVWRALTERAILAEWFMRTDLEPRVGHRFTLLPDGLGVTELLDGELVEVVPARRLVMLWRGEQMHSRVTWELVPLPGGCRVQLRHTGFIGARGVVRRRELERAYDLMLAERLPRVLDRLAAGAWQPWAPVRSSAGAPFADEQGAGPAPAGVGPVMPDAGPAAPGAGSAVPGGDPVVPGTATSGGSASGGDPANQGDGGRGARTGGGRPGAGRNSRWGVDGARRARTGADGGPAGGPPTAPVGGPPPAPVGGPPPAPVGGPFAASARGPSAEAVRGASAEAAGDRVGRPAGAPGSAAAGVPAERAAGGPPNATAGGPGSTRGRGSGRPRLLGWLHAIPHHRRAQFLAVLAAILLGVITMALISSLGGPSFIPPLSEPEPPAIPGTAGQSPAVVPPPVPVSPGAAAPTAGPPGGTAAPGRTVAPGSAPRTPTGVPAPSGQPGGVGQPAAPSWSADYSTLKSNKNGFKGEVMVTNTGSAPASEWTVVVTVPSGGQLINVKGASAAQSGNTITFTPDGDSQIGPGVSARITFKVNGVAGPTGCRVEGGACTGVPG